MILLDTSGLVANYEAEDPHHAACAALLALRQPRILSPFVLAELDYLVSSRVGPAAERAVLHDVARGAYQLEPFTAADIEIAVNVIDRHADLRLGLADASIVVLAARHACHDLLTLDQRHFRTVRALDGRHFRLLPLDDALLK